MGSESFWGGRQEGELLPVLRVVQRRPIKFVSGWMKLSQFPELLLSYCLFYIDPLYGVLEVA